MSSIRAPALLVFSIAAAATPNTTSAQPAAQVLRLTPGADIATSARVFAAEQAETIDDYHSLQAAGHFDGPGAPITELTERGADLWVIVDVSADADTGPWIVWFSGAAQYIDALYLDNGAGNGNRAGLEMRNGFFVPPMERPMQAIGFAFPLDVAAGETQRLVFRGYFPPREAQVELVPKEEFLRSNLILTVIVFGAIGAMLALAIYNLLIFFSTRDRTYAFYAVYAVVSSLMWATHFSVLSLFLTDGPTVLVLHAGTIAVNVIAAMRFTQVFLELRSIAPKLDRTFYVMYAALLSIIPLALALPQPVFKPIAMGIALPVLGTLVSAPFYVLWRGHRRARFMVIGWTPLLLGGLLLPLNIFGLVPYAWITKEVLVSLHAFEVLSMGLAVADRIRLLEEDRSAAQSEAVRQLELRLDAADRLTLAEAEVDRQRTAALTDALTGLGNRAAFDREFSERAARCADGREQNAVLVVVDLDGLKTINDTRGHEAGDALLEAFAKNLAAALRDSDRVYRIGGDEFTIVAKADGAAAFGPLRQRIEGAIEKVRAEGFPAIDASSGLTLLSEVEHDPDAAFRLADSRMYEEKRRHRDET